MNALASCLSTLLWLTIIVAVPVSGGLAQDMAAGIAPAAGAEPAGDEVVYTNRPRFRIPFRYDHAEMQRLGAREVRLFLSADRGSEWRHVQSVEPASGGFDFQAPGDGEYWFAVRTLDGAGQLQPPLENPAALEAGLKVAVDTAAPELQLALRQVAPGRIELQWNCRDPHVDPSTLRMEFIQTGDQAWQPVQVTPQASGQTAWSVPQGGWVAVRGTVSDRAQNTAHAQQQVRIEPAAVAPRPAAPDLNQPIAAAPAPFTGGAIGQFINDALSARPPIISGIPAPQPAAPAAPTAVPAAVSGDEGNSSRVVSTRRFQIGYAIDDVGPSGVGSVELFITEDGGRKWYKYGDDTDRQSPAQVEVPRDGVYGFDIRVQSGVGLADPPPQPGDPPAMVIVVDGTPPVVQLAPVRQGRGMEANRLELQWTLEEANPAAAPITVSYGASPAGPWTPVGGWQPNTGRYQWTVGPNMPQQFYVQVTARDVAGNLASAATRQPILIDLSKPTARIVDVETIGR